MAANQAPSKAPVQKKPQSIASATQEYRVRIPRNTSKTMSIMKFGTSSKCDLTKTKQANIERENNFKEFKSAYNIEDQPKFGAGSEYGREAKEEARRKKYGIIKKKYKSEEQPWILKTGTGKDMSTYKGTREGTISENTSYYVFIQGPEPGSFEAHPVSEWNQFNPVIKYKYLNSDEAEEEFARRNKTLSYFSIMLKKRIRNEDVKEEDPDEAKDKAKPGKPSSSLRLTEIEDWTDEDEADGEGSDNEDTKKPKAKAKKKFVQVTKKKKKRPENSDEEAFEESDEGDNDDKEIDYITDTSSSGDEEKDVLEKDKSKYDEKGVEQEEGLRDMNESEESEQEEENKDEKDNKSEKGEQDEVKSESSGSSSESDPEVTSALFMQKKRRPGSPASSKGGSKPNSRSNTPIPSAAMLDDKGKKRPVDAVSGSPVVDNKKARTDTPKPVVQKRTESPTPTPSASAISPGDQGITEDTIRRYLMRKPMTVKDLLQKFKSKKTGMNNEQLMTTVGKLLKKVNPEKTMIKEKLHLFIKK